MGWEEVIDEFHVSPVGCNPGVKNMANELLKLRSDRAELIECVRELSEALKFYATPSRDQSFEGWQKEWRYVVPKCDSDYEFYPNHDVSLVALTQTAEVRKKFGVE